MMLNASIRNRQLAVVLTILGLFIGLSLLGPSEARAEPGYPTRPITIVVPFPAGGPFDIIARAISIPMSRKLGQPIVVENVAGASGMIGTAKVARAAPDGYTLLLGSSGTQALNPNVFAKVPYKSPEDFQPIAELARIPSVLTVGANSPYKTVSELISQMSKKPGEITLGNAGAGSVSNLAALTFLANTKGKVTRIPYKGTAPAFTDLMGGQIDALFDTTVQAIPLIKGGRVRALAVTSSTRLASLPDVPTLNETCCKGVELLIWYGIFAPAHIPKDVQAALSKAALEARADQQFIASMRAGEALLPPQSEGIAAFTLNVNRDLALFGELVRNAGIPKE